MKKAQINLAWMNKNILMLIIIGLLIFLIFFSTSPTITNNTFIQTIREFLEVEPAPADVVGDECFDSDGDDAYTNGYVEKGSTFFYDECRSDYVVDEYICVDNDIQFVTYACPLGWRCFDSRSGDYCYNPDGSGEDEGGGGEDDGGYTYDECYGLAQEHGKDYSEIGTGGEMFDDFWECDQYAWDYCDGLGSSIKLLDWFEPNCCIWSCN